MGGAPEPSRESWLTRLGGRGGARLRRYWAEELRPAVQYLWGFWTARVAGWWGRRAR
jgi:hypothetical protein